jgi:hypothetical protein
MKRARARAARAMTNRMTVVGEEEGKDSKAMAMATRVVVGERMPMATKRVMATKTRVAEKEEGNGKGNNSNGNGKEDSNGEQQQ